MARAAPTGYYGGPLQAERAPVRRTVLIYRQPAGGGDRWPGVAHHNCPHITTARTSVLPVWTNTRLFTATANSRTTQDDHTKRERADKLFAGDIRTSRHTAAVQTIPWHLRRCCLTNDFYTVVYHSNFEYNVAFTIPKLQHNYCAILNTWL